MLGLLLNGVFDQGIRDWLVSTWKTVDGLDIERYWFCVIKMAYYREQERP